MRVCKISWTGLNLKAHIEREFLWFYASHLLCTVIVIRNLPRSSMTKYPKWWMKCSKGSEPSLGEKWPLDQQKWSVLLKDTKFTFVRHGLEDLKEPETGAPKGSTKEYGGVYFLSQKRFFHHAYQDSEINPCHGKRGHNTNDCYQLKKQIEEVVASGKLAHLVKDICLLG
ncbi:hypothetical protein Tco_0826172 [Tanacetum coccineum]